MLLWFLLQDESDPERWQSGLISATGSGSRRRRLPRDAGAALAPGPAGALPARAGGAGRAAAGRRARPRRRSPGSPGRAATRRRRPVNRGGARRRPEALRDSASRRRARAARPSRARISSIGACRSSTSRAAAHGTAPSAPASSARNAALGRARSGSSGRGFRSCGWIPSRKVNNGSGSSSRTGGSDRSTPAAFSGVSFMGRRGSRPGSRPRTSRRPECARAGAERAAGLGLLAVLGRDPDPATGAADAGGCRGAAGRRVSGRLLLLPPLENVRRFDQISSLTSSRSR